MGILFQKGVFGLDTKFRRSALGFTFHFIPFHLSLSHGIFSILLYFLLLFYFIFQDTLSSFTCNV